MIVIEKFKVQNNGPKNKKSFIISFVPCQQIWTNKFMSNKYIYKEALGTLFEFGPKALKALVSHAKNRILPIHGLTRRVDHKSAKYEMNILPSLAKNFFLTEIVPLAGARPTQFTRDAVTQTQL